MVMVFRTEILLHLVSLSAPKLYCSFQQIFKSLGTCRESLTIEKVYRRMDSLNFSKDLLEGFDLHSRNQLSVVPMSGVFWSDWGSENRIIAVLKSIGYLDRLPGGLLPDDARDQLPEVVGAGMQANL